MTQPLEGRPASLAELIAKWRDAAVWEHDDMDNTQSAQTFDQCANELEAALVAASGETYRFDNADVSWQVHTSPVASGAPPPQQQGSACINCGEANDGGYECEDGPGPFCSSCWLALEDHFKTGAPPQDIREPIKYGVVHFHPQKELRERFYHVVNDLRDAACIVDFWLMDIASVLKEFGYEMTITKPPAPPADVRAILEGEQ